MLYVVTLVWLLLYCNILMHIYFNISSTVSYLGILDKSWKKMKKENRKLKEKERETRKRVI